MDNVTQKTPAANDAMRDVVSRAMQETWNDWVSDTRCYPDDITQEANGTLRFESGAWALNVADAIFQALNSRPVRDEPQMSKTEFLEDRVLAGFDCMRTLLGLPALHYSTDELVSMLAAKSAKEDSR